MWIALAIGLIVTLVVVLGLVRHTSSTYPLHLLDDGSGNEALIIEAVVAHERVLFLVDTAYAGAPVLSVSYMNCLRKNRRLTTGSLRRRFRSTMLALETPMTTFEKHETLNEYVGRGACKTFTSGCTMRLMGIGETSENQSDMFLCPPIALDGRRRGGRCGRRLQPPLRLRGHAAVVVAVLHAALEELRHGPRKPLGQSVLAVLAGGAEGTTAARHDDAACRPVEESSGFDARDAGCDDGRLPLLRRGALGRARRGD